MQRKETVVEAAQGLGPRWRAGGLGGGGSVVTAGPRSWGEGMDGPGRKGLKVGPALQTSAHTPYSDPVTHVSLSLNGWRGQERGWACARSNPGSAARLWEVADLTVSTQEPPVLRTHGLRRTHTPRTFP